MRLQKVGSEHVCRAPPVSLATSQKRGITTKLAAFDEFSNHLHGSREKCATLRPSKSDQGKHTDHEAIFSIANQICDGCKPTPSHHYLHRSECDLAERRAGEVNSDLPAQKSADRHSTRSTSVPVQHSSAGAEKIKITVLSSKHYHVTTTPDVEARNRSYTGVDSDTFAASEEKFAKNRAGATATGAESDKSGQADFDSQHTENENERAMLSSSSTRVQNSMKIDIPQPQVLSMPSGSTPKMILENIVEAAQSDQFNRSVHISDTFSSVREIEVRLSPLGLGTMDIKMSVHGHRLTLDIVAEAGSVVGWLKGELDSLKETLKQSGYLEVHLSLNSRDPPLNMGAELNAMAYRTPSGETENRQGRRDRSKGPTTDSVAKPRATTTETGPKSGVYI